VASKDDTFEAFEPSGSHPEIIFSFLIAPPGTKNF